MIPPVVTRTSDIEATAAMFAEARATATGLGHWPGTAPQTLEAAYALQRASHLAWGGPMGGVKVGRVLGHWADHVGVDRFTGPIDTRSIVVAPDKDDCAFPVIVGGTALLECEVIAVISRDMPDGRALRDQPMTPEQARMFTQSLHIGIEIAGSPVMDVNALGPLASIACFGNNNGAILGPEIAGWRDTALERLSCSASLDGKTVGEGDLSRLPGGIWAAIAFACNQAASLGQSLRKGQIICTGALTGMHPIVAGQVACADFGAFGRLMCRAIPQPPSNA